LEQPQKKNVCGQKVSSLKSQILTELNTARADLFQYQIDSGIEKTITILQKIALLAKEIDKEKDLNEITASLMGALGQKDYLLFADIAFYEIPALFDHCLKYGSCED
jgi:hypothetical protein